MADDAARIAQLEAEIRALRDVIEHRDRALDEAREQQAATTGILRALASAPTEAQQVLDEVVATAGRLLASDFVVLHRRVRDHMGVVAFHGSQAERFFRAQNVTAIQGTGLGLNIVNRYVKLMNGELKFTSEENVGSEFVVRFEQLEEEKSQKA